MARSTFNPIKFVNPPEKVQVDLTALFPSSPHHKVAHRAQGLRVCEVVEGELSRIGLTVEGETLLYVTYKLEFNRDKAPQSQWVPAWVVRPAAQPEN
ncbi:hypothetical protein [Rhodococcoides kyotonense]|uniref:Uncharacterized protein n=1 Tax=Rhodococcoides kyotonense TaxID=398843 RepID=A0A239MVA5_9NOCA|nr:hypothetical protein [Rhodococcus kyotonensis]SNT46661.1 hypothetical protein SAMN05421642_12343 [Rhodococcus kyotonensis]